MRRKEKQPNETQERMTPQAAGYDSLGPAIHSGGEQVPGGPVPPYPGRQTSAADRPPVTPRPYEPGPGREITPEEQEGVASTDMRPEAPPGVGVTMGTQGNELALGKDDEERRKDREEAGVRPPKPLT